MAPPVFNAARAREMSAEARSTMLSREFHERAVRVVQSALREVAEMSEHGFRRALCYFDCPLAFSKWALAPEERSQAALALDYILNELKKLGFTVQWSLSAARKSPIIITIDW